jgi:hypothetical protein
MSDSETGDSDTGSFDAHQKTEQLLREVFRPVLSRQSESTAPMRERLSLHGYNFRKEAKETASDGHLDEFTPRCLMNKCITEQKTLVQDAIGNVTDADWKLMASFLSPAKPPLHPSTKSNTHSRPCRFTFPSKIDVVPNVIAPCLCISCAGMKAKPRCTPCLVCGASIVYSVCLKLKRSAQSPVPSMCFKCKCAFLSP